MKQEHVADNDCFSDFNNNALVKKTKQNQT